MNIVVPASIALAIIAFASFGWPLLRHWQTIERFRHAPGSMTLSVLGKNGRRVKVKLRANSSGGFDEKEIDKFISAFTEADGEGPSVDAEI